MNVDLTACIDGDKQAWDAFVDRWARVIFAAVRRTMQRPAGADDQADVEDVVQDVFVRLVRDDFKLLRSYDPNRSSLSTWLTVVARSGAISAMRNRRLKTVPLPATHEPAAPDGEDIPDGQIELPLQLLSSRQRLVLHALYDRGLSVSDAARLMDVEEQTVRSLKHKALTRLREHFAPT